MGAYIRRIFRLFAGNFLPPEGLSLNEFEMNNNKALKEKRFSFSSDVDELQLHALPTLPKPVEDIIHSEGRASLF